MSLYAPRTPPHHGPSATRNLGLHPERPWPFLSPSPISCSFLLLEFSGCAKSGVPRGEWQTDLAPVPGSVNFWLCICEEHRQLQPTVTPSESFPPRGSRERFHKGTGAVCSSPVGMLGVTMGLQTPVSLLPALGDISFGVWKSWLFLQRQDK